MARDGIVKVDDQFVYRPGPLSAGIVIDQFLIGDDLLVAVIPYDVQSQAFDLVVCSEEAFAREDPPRLTSRVTDSGEDSSSIFCSSRWAQPRR